MIVSGEDVTIWGDTPGGPIIYLHVFEGNGEDVWARCQELDCPDFSLVAVSPPDWDDALSPWPSEPISNDGRSCGGHDDDGVAEVHLASLAIRETTFIEHLKKNVEDVGMGLLDLVEEDD